MDNHLTSTNTTNKPIITNDTLDEFSVRFHTCVRAGYEGKLALILVCV